MPGLKNILLILIFSCASAASSSGQSGNYVVDFATNIKLEKNKLVVEKSYLIQINDKDSEWISDIKIPYNENDKLEILDASIINSKGEVVRKLKKKEIITRSDISEISFFEDDLVNEFKLKWHEYPYRIKYSYRETTDKFVYVCRWYPVVYPTVYTQSASLQVELPKDYPVSLKHSGELEYAIDTLADSFVHKWKASDIQSFRKEAFSPPIQELLANVSIVPKQFSYGLEGSFNSWTEYGKWVEQMNTGLDELPLSEKRKIDQMVQGITDQREIIKTLYHYMQDNTRYINVSIDVGGLKPYPASYVCEKKYGDCKALTIYMKALLKHVGIPSYYTAIYAGDNPVKVDTEFPAQQFNHVILNVPLNGDTIWLENTAQHIPYDYLGTFTQNRNALFVDGDNSRLIKTPGLKEEDVIEKSTFTFTLDERGTGTVNVSHHVKGDAFETARYIEHSLLEKDQRRYFEQALPLNNFQLLNWGFSKPDRDYPEINVDLSLAVNDQIRKVADILAIKPFEYSELNFEHPQKRKLPLRINIPVHKTDSLIYNLSFLEKYRSEVPENVYMESRFGSYGETYIKKENQLIVSRKLLLKQGDYPLKEYPDFYSFIDSIKNSQLRSVLVINPL